LAKASQLQSGISANGGVPMKFFILFVSMILGNLAHAALSFEVAEPTAPVRYRTFISESRLEKLNLELLKNLYEVEVADASSSSLAKVNDLLGFADKCDSFATIKDMGQWGSLILNEMKRTRYSDLYRGAPDLSAVCPNFNSAGLGDDGREVVWVMIVNAMAHLESSCSLKAPAKGPNGALVGLLQLHNGAEQKYGKYCQKGDGKTAAGTFRCGLSMLEGQLSRDNSLFSRKSYWDVLRPQAKSQKYLKIKKALSNLSICKAGASVFAPDQIKNVPVPTPRPRDIDTAPPAESVNPEPTVTPQEPSKDTTPGEHDDFANAPSIEDIIRADQELGKSADSLGAQLAD
jgi:hypothetical protein